MAFLPGLVNNPIAWQGNVTKKWGNLGQYLLKILFRPLSKGNNFHFCFLNVNISFNMSLRYRVSILTMSQLSEEGPKSCVERTSKMLTEASTCLPASTLNKFWSLVLKAC